MKFLGKNLVLGVTASVAIYKSLDLIRELRKQGFEVRVILSHDATKLIRPQLFAALSHGPVFVDEFYDDSSGIALPTEHLFPYPHLKALEGACLFCIAPATANILAKAASGEACDLLSTALLAFDGPKIMVPAMNVRMWKNPLLQENVQKLQRFGFHFVGPEFGDLACGDIGVGHMASVSSIEDAIFFHVVQKDLNKKRILITAGPTREFFDPVRFLSSPASGKMGYAIAREAAYRGAEVILVTGHTQLPDPFRVRLIRIQSAQEMYDAVEEEFSKSDVFISAASVSDYGVQKFSPSKMKRRGGFENISLRENVDILREMGKKKRKGQILIGFALETDRSFFHARQKFRKKNLDACIVNGAPSFSADSATFSFLTGKKVQHLGEISKAALASHILDFVV